VLENGALRNRVGGRDGIIEGWRESRDDELHNLCSSPDVIVMFSPRRMRWSVHVALVGEIESTFRVLVGRAERRRPLGRPRCRWKWILEEKYGGVWTELIWARIGTNDEFM
jgi:hypothetical protein